MSHHFNPPNEFMREEQLESCKQERDLINDIMNNTQRVQKIYPTIPERRSQLRRSIGHIGTMWTRQYWEVSERFQLLSYYQTATTAKTWMDNNY